MFTGIVEGTGRVESLESGAEETRLRVSVPFGEAPVRGASVAVDGVCLTSVRSGPGWFEAVVSPETLSRTTLGERSPGDRVNLERPLRLGDRLGGHLVQGHVDGVGTVLRVVPEGTGTRVRIGHPADLEDLIVQKGSIAVDGVSLTVARRQSGAFEVALIPETLALTHLADYVPGRRVNLEVDMMGRYVVDCLRRRDAERAAAPVTREQLERHGFIREDGER
ncbi:MAG: riboflavin synthase [Acidobacteriota bacterium]